ncbi:glycosyltransferase family protein [Salix suchowensis]|nr:glycosyltransferase family protein [Salix suchowensis]
MDPSARYRLRTRIHLVRILFRYHETICPLHASRGKLSVRPLCDLAADTGWGTRAGIGDASAATAAMDNMGTPNEKAAPSYNPSQQPQPYYTNLQTATTSVYRRSPIEMRFPHTHREGGRRINKAAMICRWVMQSNLRLLGSDTSGWSRITKWTLTPHHYCRWNLDVPDATTLSPLADRTGGLRRSRGRACASDRRTTELELELEGRVTTDDDVGVVVPPHLKTAGPIKNKVNLAPRSKKFAYLG